MPGVTCPSCCLLAHVPLGFCWFAPSSFCARESRRGSSCVGWGGAGDQPCVPGGALLEGPVGTSLSLSLTMSGHGEGQGAAHDGWTLVMDPPSSPKGGAEVQPEAAQPSSSFLWQGAAVAQGGGGQRLWLKHRLLFRPSDKCWGARTCSVGTGTILKAFVVL